MKMEIKWHEECLRNATDSYERDKALHEAEHRRLETRRVSLAIYEYQIKLAKERGMTAFDRDRFNRSRSSAAESGRPE